MEIIQLRCFVAVAEKLHFGRAAQSLDMLPASLGRYIGNLEDSLGVRLINRTTRHVALTAVGAELLDDIKDLLNRVENIEAKAHNFDRLDSLALRVGSIDSAAAGLLPPLLNFFKTERPDIEVTLFEQKTIRLLPRLLSGRLDLAFVRPPDVRPDRIVFRPLLNETPVVAVPTSHPLADRSSVKIEDLAQEPLIVPDRGSRPHSHDLTIQLFAEAGLTAKIAQIAEEKQTIVNIVSAGLGLAIVPRWASRFAVGNVKFVPIETHSSQAMTKLSLAAAWVRDVRDPARDALLDCLIRHLEDFQKSA